eukprot:scaffold121292_cov69-Phaeocystis_antarctica.AAC.1
MPRSLWREQSGARLSSAGGDICERRERGWALQPYVREAATTRLRELRECDGLRQQWLRRGAEDLLVSKTRPIWPASGAERLIGRGWPRLAEVATNWRPTEASGQHLEEASGEPAGRSPSHLGFDRARSLHVADAGAVWRQASQLEDEMRPRLGCGDLAALAAADAEDREARGRREREGRQELDLGAGRVRAVGVKGGRSCTASPSARKFWRGAAPPRYDPAALPRPIATQPSSAQPALLITIALIALGGLRLRWIVATAELARQCVASLSSRWLAGWASDSLLQYSTSSTTGSPLTEHMPRPSVEYGCGRSTAGPQCQEQRLGARRAKLQGCKRPDHEVRRSYILSYLSRDCVLFLFYRPPAQRVLLAHAPADRRQPPNGLLTAGLRRRRRLCLAAVHPRAHAQGGRGGRARAHRW